MFPNTPRFVYGSSQFIPTYPARAWNPSDEPIGGARISAAGVPASYIVRRDALLELTLRFTEAEWPTVRALVAFGQSGQEIAWYPDAAEVTSFSVYLHAPAAGERWGPTRSADFPRVFELTLTLRGVDDAVPWVAFF